MMFCVRIFGWILLLAVVTLGSGCRYAANRFYDFRDTFAVGVGVTGENPVTGIVPPSLGLYVEATDWLHLGAIHYNGYTAELDLRGTFVGPECETRFGLLWWQMIRKNQSYKDACFVNKFKVQDFPWCNRMEGIEMRHGGHAAKRVHYEYYQQYLMRGTGLLHRGWQYWEYAGFEAAICEPFLTHAGVMVRAGIDLSEVSDFLLGWICVDFKHDDMSSNEFQSFLDNPTCWGLRMMPAKPRREPMPPSEELKSTPAPLAPAPAPAAPMSAPAVPAPAEGTVTELPPPAVL